MQALNVPEIDILSGIESTQRMNDDWVGDVKFN